MLTSGGFYHLSYLESFSNVFHKLFHFVGKMMLNFLLCNVWNLSFVIMGQFPRSRKENLKNHPGSNPGSLPLLKASCVIYGDELWVVHAIPKVL